MRARESATVRAALHSGIDSPLGVSNHNFGAFGQSSWKTRYMSAFSIYMHVNYQLLTYSRYDIL